MSGPTRVGAHADLLLANLRRAIDRSGGLIPDDQAPPRQDPREAARDRQWRDLMPRKMWDAEPAVLDDPAKRRVVDRWLSDPSRNLILLGDLGRGKTFTAAAAVRPLHRQGRRVVFWPLGKLMKQLGGDFGGGEAFTAAATADVLILDDVGTANLAGSRKADWLYDLINDRYLDELPTIITTNIRPRAAIAADPDPDQPDEPALQDAVTDRVFDRLKEHCIAVSIGGHDRRAARQEGTAT